MYIYGEIALWVQQWKTIMLDIKRLASLIFLMDPAAALDQLLMTENTKALV